MTIYYDLSLSSDHKAVQLTYTDNTPLRTKTKRLMWHLQKLKNPDICTTYINIFIANIQPIQQRINAFLDNKTTTTIETIEEFNLQLNDSIYNALDNTVGHKTTAEINRLRWFWNLDFEKAKTHRETCFKKWRRAQHPSTKLK